MDRHRKRLICRALRVLRNLPALAGCLLAAATPQVAARQLPSSGAKAAPAPKPDLRQQLFTAARKALVSTPDGFAPVLLLQIVDLEGKGGGLAPEESARRLDEYRQLAQMAKEMPAPSDSDDDLAKLRDTYRIQIVKATILDLSAAGRPAEALGMVRQLDGTPFQRMLAYQDILEFAGYTRTPAPTFAELMAIIKECETNTGMYPYTGAGRFLMHLSTDSGPALALARDGYRHAAAETNEQSVGGATYFLAEGHRITPALDPVLIDAIESLIGRVAAIEDQNPVINQTGAQLLQLESIVAPNRAADMKLRYPAYNHNVTSALRIYGANDPALNPPSRKAKV
ncbi:MAG: hypothetical protein ACRD1E_03220, partial [Terriglobales bacterium]